MIKKALIVATALMLSIGMAFATATPEISVTEIDKDTRTMIIGTVNDAETGEAIPGAEVTLTGAEATATTDDYGTFTFEDVEAGTYTISVDADGYAAAEEEVEVSEEGANVAIELEAEGEK